MEAMQTLTSNINNLAVEQVEQDLGSSSPIFMPEILVRQNLGKSLVGQSIAQKMAAVATTFAIGKSTPLQIRAKRVMDLTGALFLLTLLSPMFLVLAILIKLDSRGPVFFQQERIGRNGKTFPMFKFRSMHTNATERLQELLAKNESNSVMFKMTNDPRVTRVGRFIRKYSLDEFPQLFNVVLGHMSLVGPRPPIMREVEQYEDWHHVRFSTRPGMTGLWQVSGRASIKDFNHVVCLDFEYIQRWSLLADIGILFRTLPAVISGDGAA